MKSKILMILSCCLFLIGFGLFVYPSVSSYYNRKQLDKISQIVEEKIEKVDHKEFEELYLKMEDYNRNLYETNQSELNSEEAYEIPCMDLREYGFENNEVGVLEIPSIQLTVPILLGATYENMFNGVTHLSNTSLPIGGINTNCVISGHRGMVNKEMFRNIEKIQIGDTIFIKNYWDTLTYEVKEIEIVEVDEVDRIFIQEGKDMITLITCHPYQVFNQRYLVYCERVKKD